MTNVDEELPERHARGAGARAEGGDAAPRNPEPLEASLAAHLRLLWEVDLGDTPMAVQVETRSNGD